MKIVKVPQCDIDRINAARKEIYGLIDGIEKGEIPSNTLYYNMIGITGPLYYISNRKYKETFLSKLKRLICRQK